jgi:hypothetical protein
MEKFKFTPEQGFLDGTAYPNTKSEQENREQLQRPLNQLRDYVNELLGIIPTDEQLQKIVTNHELILELEKSVKELEENSNSYADYDEETGNLQINSTKDVLNVFNELSNPNLLINSDFRNPINQRGQSTYQCASSKTYTIDRWHGWEVKVDIKDGYINISSDTKNDFKQALENYLPSNIYTLSVKVKSITGTVKATIYHETEEAKELSVGLNTLTVNGSFRSVFIKLEAGASVDIEWMKLEQGSVATPLAPRPIGEELALCRRYYRTERIVVSYRNRTESNSYAFYIPIPTDVRATNSIRLLTLNSRTEDGLVDSESNSIADISSSWVQCYAKFNKPLDGNQILVLYEIDAEI